MSNDHNQLDAQPVTTARQTTTPPPSGIGLNHAVTVVRPGPATTSPPSGTTLNHAVTTVTARGGSLNSATTVVVRGASYGR